MPQVTRGSTHLYMQYHVLARKWRPQNFRDLVGQEHISRTLINALQSGRVAHAFLFSGPRGSGKTTTARILAKAVNCHADTHGEPCGQCISCMEIAAGNSIDVLEIDAASNTGVDNIRNIIEEVQYRPARDRNKIYIVDEVHMLSTAAFNALLKTLEEPPSHVIFIMATTEYHKIPATILSRCQQYSFKLIKYPLILDRLQTIARAESIQISTASLEQIAFSSGGSMRDAMSALDQVIAFSGNDVRDEDVNLLLGLVEPAVLGDTVRAVAANDTQGILKIMADLAEAGQDFQNFCRRLLGQFRNLMVLKAGVSDASILGVPESLIPELGSQAALFSREDLLRLFDSLLRVEADLKHATQVRFQLEMGLLELAHLARLRSLEELIAEFRGEPAPVPGGPQVPANFRPTASSSGPQKERHPQRSADRATGEPVTPTKRVPVPENNLAVETSTPSKPELETPVHAGADSRELLEKIASAVQKESLESFLHGLQGAKLDGDSVILDPGVINDFYRRQVQENLALITGAASSVVGRPVKVRLGDESARRSAPVAESADPHVKVLERAKREPVVQSFLEVFPGPVKAENLDK